MVKTNGKAVVRANVDHLSIIRAVRHVATTLADLETSTDDSCAPEILRMLSSRIVYGLLAAAAGEPDEADEPRHIDIARTVRTFACLYGQLSDDSEADTLDRLRSCEQAVTVALERLYTPAEVADARCLYAASVVMAVVEADHRAAELPEPPEPDLSSLSEDDEGTDYVPPEPGWWLLEGLVQPRGTKPEQGS